MKIIDLKKANIVLLVMAIFMSCQVSVLASAGHTTVKIPVNRFGIVKSQIFQMNFLML